MKPWLTLVGIGEDGYPGLGKAARRALLAAHVSCERQRKCQATHSDPPSAVAARPGPDRFTPPR